MRETRGYEPNRGIDVARPVLSPEYLPSPGEILDPQSYIKALQRGRKFLGEMLREVGF